MTEATATPTALAQRTSDLRDDLAAVLPMVETIARRYHPLAVDIERAGDHRGLDGMDWADKLERLNLSTFTEATDLLCRLVELVELALDQ